MGNGIVTNTDYDQKDSEGTWHRTCQVFRTPVMHPDRIYSYFLREWKTLLIVAVSGTLFNLGQSLCAMRQGQLVDAIAAQEKHGSGEVLHAAIVFLMTVMVVQLLRLAKRYYVRRFANATDISMRMMVYNRIIHEDIGSLEAENSGQVMTKALGDVDLTVEGMRKATTEVFDTGVLLTGYLVTMLRGSVPCTVLSLLPVPFALLTARFLKRYVEASNRRAREMSAQVAGASLDAVRNSLIYRVTGSAGRQEAAYESRLSALEKEQISAGILENAMQPAYNAITLCGTLVVLFYGGRLVLAGNWTVGAFTAYLTIYLAFSLKIAKVSKLLNACQKASVSWKRVKPYLSGWREEDSDSVPRHSEADMRETAITLLCRNLTVSRGGRELFFPVSFTGKKGQLIGITGPVASGKSTLGEAIAGIRTCSGTVRVVGHDLALLSGAEKSELISYMGHRPELFDLSLRDNILLGRREDPDRLSAVLHDVCLGEDLEKMGKGALDRRTGSAGKMLSGGQRSRISCARALYGGQPLIVLDEPFANVDKDTEQKMIRNLKAHHSNSLLILITHRMRALVNADLVLMIEENGYVRTGTHESLMRESERYRESFLLQEKESMQKEPERGNL